MVKDATGEDSMKEALRAFESLVREESKADRLNGLVKALSGFLQLARHPQLPHVEIKPADATLALHTTGAILSYLGSH